MRKDYGKNNQCSYCGEYFNYLGIASHRSACRKKMKQPTKKEMLEKEFYGPCLPQRKRHYFGRDTGWAGGMGQPRTHECVWCGKYNPKWEPKFWEED